MENLYWTAIAAIFGALWAVAIFVRDRNASAVQQTSALIGRILEIDKFLMEHPEIQKYISFTAAKPEEYFRSPGVLEDDMFYKAKSLAYFHINLFDDLLSLAERSRTWLTILMPPRVRELPDWEVYITRKFSHPLYRSILNNEGEIFGAALRGFWAVSKQSLDPAGSKPHNW